MIPGEIERDPLADDEEQQVASLQENSDFARMLGESEDKKFRFVKPGSKLDCRIVSIGVSSIFVDVGQRSEGSVEKSQFTAEELTELKVGQLLNLFVISASGGSIELSKRLKMLDLDFDKLREAQQNGIPIEGKVSGENKGGFTVDLPGGKGFVPFSQMDLPPTKPAAEYIGKVFQFLVTRIERKEAVLSRTVLLREQEQEEQAKVLAALQPGAMLEGTIIKLESFGAFIDLGHRLNALIPRSELSFGRVNEVSEAVTVGQKVTVKLLNIDRTGPKVRISASLKQVGKNPWDDDADSVQVGQVLKGTVSKLMPFGAFVELRPGLEGLIHISEMSGKRRISQPGEAVQVDQVVEVKVLSVDRISRRIGLSLRALQGDDLDDATKAKYLKQEAAEQEGRGVELVHEGGMGGAFGDAFADAQRHRKKAP